jgi:hypothetical protein
MMIVFGKPKWCKMSHMKVTTQFAVSVAIGLYSIHLVNLSMATNTCVKPPSTVVKGRIMSKPQHTNGHEGGMVMRLSARTWDCLPKNWQLVHWWTSASASAKAPCQLMCEKPRGSRTCLRESLEYFFALLHADTLHDYAWCWSTLVQVAPN